MYSSSSLSLKMGQEASVPVQGYNNLLREYKNLQLDYDSVADELDELYADYDNARAALMNKHRGMSELGVASSPEM